MVPVRIAHDRDRRVLHTTRYPWSTDGPYTTRTSTSMSSATAHRSPIVYTATKTPSCAYKAPSIHHSCAHDGTQYNIRSPFRPATRHYLCARYPDPNMGYHHWETRAGTPQRDGQGRDLWCCLPPGRAGGVCMERQRDCARLRSHLWFRRFVSDPKTHSGCDRL